MSVLRKAFYTLTFTCLTFHPFTAKAEQPSLMDETQQQQKESLVTLRKMNAELMKPHTQAEKDELCNVAVDAASTYFGVTNYLSTENLNGLPSFPTPEQMSTVVKTSFKDVSIGLREVPPLITECGTIEKGPTTAAEKEIIEQVQSVNDKMLETVKKGSVALDRYKSTEAFYMLANNLLSDLASSPISDISFNKDDKTGSTLEARKAFAKETEQLAAIMGRLGNTVGGAIGRGNIMGVYFRNTYDQPTTK